MASQEVIGLGAALESLDDTKTVPVSFISKSGRYYEVMIKAGEMKKATTLGLPFSDGRLHLGHCLADVKVADDTSINVDHCIDIERPRNSGHFFMTYRQRQFPGSSRSMGEECQGETHLKQLCDAFQIMPQVVNSELYQSRKHFKEAGMDAIGILVEADNTSNRSQIANAWKTGLSELSVEAHNRMKEVVGMGMMGISASAGYGSQSVIAKATCALAFASSATAFFLPRKWITTIRFLTKVGAIGCIGGVLAAIGHDLPLECKWWVTAFAFVAPAAAVVFS